ncbi:MAG: hypothetical protein GY759_09160 [Chloroflexi bacterium]|nr:hypothetical protein [Chloroflexota bacterium]
MSNIIIDFANDGVHDGLFNGALPREDNHGENFATFASEYPTLIPRDQWESLAAAIDDEGSIEALVQKIKNQRQEGTCTANEVASAIEIIWCLTFGVGSWVELSPISLYKQCARGPNSGSSVSCIVKTAQNIGALPVDNEKNRAWMESVGLNPAHVLDAVGFSQRYPQDWEQTASSFRIKEVFDIGSFEEFITALLMGFPVCYGRKGHSILGVRLVFIDGKPHIKYLNSWGDWGDNGYGYDSERFVANAIAQYGAFAVRTCYVPDFMS